MSRRNTVKRAKGNGRHRKARVRLHPALGLVGVLFALAVFIAVGTQPPLISGALAQVDTAAPHDLALHLGHGTAEPPEPLFDGSVRPEDIPDSLAINMLMDSLRIPNESDATGLRQLQSKAARVNLSEGDFAILVSELVEFDVAAKAQEARMEAVRASSVPGISAASARFLQDRFMEEQSARSELAEDHFEQLLESLSPAGRTRLEEHLFHVKTRIRIYPPPDMSKQIL